MLAAIDRGVRVRILCGGKHGLHQPDLMYSFALWRLNGKSALLPTFNFMEKYFRATRDYGVLTNDPVQVEQIQKCFDCDWKREPSAGEGRASFPRTCVDTG